MRVGNKTRIFEHIQFQVAGLSDALAAIRASRSTGRLTINFSQGVPGGTVEFVRETVQADIVTTRVYQEKTA